MNNHKKRTSNIFDSVYLAQKWYVFSETFVKSVHEYS